MRRAYVHRLVKETWARTLSNKSIAAPGRHDRPGWIDRATGGGVKLTTPRLSRVGHDPTWRLALRAATPATRRSGRPTAGGSALDADVILAAEDGWQVVIVTDNMGHLARFGDARNWRTLAASP